MQVLVQFWAGDGSPEKEHRKQRKIETGFSIDT
jgi:hypothetical protein